MREGHAPAGLLVRLALLALTLALALAPAFADAASPPDAHVTLARSADHSVWSVDESLDANGTLWVPRGAFDVQAFAQNATGRAPVAWRFADADRLVVVDALDPSARLRVEFALPDQGGYASTIVRFDPGARVELRVLPAPGDAAPGGLAFTRDGDAWTFVGVAGSAPWTLHLDPPPETVGWLALAVFVALAALVTFVAGSAWSRKRLARAGPAPETLAGSFASHLAELQSRLGVVLVPFGLANLLYFAVGLRAVRVLGVALPLPIATTGASISAQVFQAFATHFLPPNVSLIVTRPTEAIVAQLEVTLFLAFVTVLPLLLVEVAGFLAPALTPREKRFFALGFPLVAGLFLLGCAFATQVLVPLILRSLYDYTAGLAALPYVSVEELVSFVLAITLAVGLAFELPLAMAILSRMGLVPPGLFVKHWRWAVVGIFVLATLVNPDPGITSQLVIALPMVALYFVGVGAAHWVTRGRRSVSGAPERSSDA